MWPSVSCLLVSRTGPALRREPGVAARAAALLEVLLVVVLGLPEGRSGLDLRLDLPRPAELGLGRRLARARRRLLLGRVEEDRRAVLRADVESLAIPRTRVVLAPEDVEDILVGDDGRVEGDLDRL